MIHRISKLLMLCLFTHDAIALAGECDTDTLEFVKNKGCYVPPYYRLSDPSHSRLRHRWCPALNEA